MPPEPTPNAPFPLDTIWSIEPLAMKTIMTAVQAHGLQAVRLPRGFEPSMPMEQREGVAIIDVTGPMTKRPSMFQAIFDASSTQMIQEAVETAAGDERIGAILLRVDSPGGSVDGLAELGDAVFAARAAKPVWAQITGTGASAAYYVASQAQKIFAERMDMTGAIGTRLTVYDWSRWFANHGVEAIPIDTGDLKSLGVMGTEVTAAQKAYLQSYVNTYFADFVDAVVRGRGMSAEAVTALADGRVFIGQAAVDNGLIDGIQTIETTLAQLMQVTTATTQKRTRSNGPMATETTQDDATPVVTSTLETATLNTALPAASFEQLKESCPGAGSDFLCEQLGKKATAEQARAAWMEKLQAENAQLTKDLAEAGIAGKAKDEKPGVESLGGGTCGGKRDDTAGDPVEQFEAAVRERMQAGTSRQAAILAVATKDPELHQGYLLATNDNRRARRLLAEKFDI